MRIPSLHQSPGLGFQSQEGKSPELLAAKTSRDWISGRNYWSPKQCLLKNPHTDSPTQTHSLWAPAAGKQLERHLWHFKGRNWSGWHQGKQRSLSFSKHLPSQSWQAGAISETPSTWLTLFDPPLGHPQSLCATQFMAPPKLLFHMNNGVGSCCTTS